MTDTINVPLLPTKVMLDAATSHALSVNIGGHYTWSDYMRDLYVLMITSTPAQPAPVQGWQMVPSVPTPKMIEVGVEARWRWGVRDPNSVWQIYQHMLAAAPKPPVQQCEAPSCGCADAYCKAWDEAPQPSDDVAKDAARYRWLRDRGDACQWENILRFDLEEFVCANNALDAAIDAAMGSKGHD